MLEVEGVGGRFGLLELGLGLADVDRDADHLVVVVLVGEQRDADRRVEAAGEGERDAVLVLSDTALKGRIEPLSDDQKLFDLATNGDLERVIIHDAARIATNMRDLTDRITTLLENDVAVHIIDSQLQLGESDDTPTDDRSMLRALEIAADLERSVSSERTREGIAAAQAAGKHVGRPPFGFDSDGNGTLVPNENFETPLAVIEQIESGDSKRSTARDAGITRATVRNIMDRKELYQTDDTRSSAQ
ncbi:Resolvase domain-containing protein [Natronolimnohabitans innermongolicus JCM 12255]|uniref:Resolvase domain-containing protein n=1 Tax=Natronolimnohabitans innermongolicus JCM 12255 TaxID=1227499 RepID=L9X0Z9_9EURY|nr:Resolvase domain-containing protein [Natronolimnohabitans innermongolicus JCM 12255]